MKSPLSRKHYLWPLAVTMYTIWNTLLKPPASFSFFRTTFLGTLIQLRDQARTLLYFLTLRNICASTISGYLYLITYFTKFMRFVKLLFSMVKICLHILFCFAITHAVKITLCKVISTHTKWSLQCYTNGYFTCIVGSLSP